MTVMETSVFYGCVEQLIVVVGVARGVLVVVVVLVAVVVVVVEYEKY